MKKKLILLSALVGLLAIGCNSTVSTSQTGSTTEKVSEKTEASQVGKIEDEPIYGQPIKFGFPGPLCIVGAPLAKELGYFEEEGLDVEIVSGVNAVESTGTGQTEFASSHIAHALVPAANGTNLKFFETTQTGCQSLLVPKGSEIKSTSDLVGKSVGLPNGIGSPDHNIVIRFLIRDGVNVEDVNFVPVELSTATQALEKGEIQACLMSDQYSAPFRDSGDLEVIRSITYDDDFTNEPCCIYMFNGEFLEENPLHAEKLEKVLKKVNLYIEDNMEEAAEIIVEKNLAPGDYETVLRNMKEYNWVVEDDVLETTLTSVIEDYKEGGVLPADTDTAVLMEEIWKPHN